MPGSEDVDMLRSIVLTDEDDVFRKQVKTPFMKVLLRVLAMDDLQLFELHRGVSNHSH